MNANKKRLLSPVGQVITQLRSAKGWNVEELARRCDLSVKTIESAERSEGKYIATARQIAVALGVDVATLCRQDSSVPAAPPPFRVVFTVEVSYDALINHRGAVEELVIAMTKWLGTSPQMVPISVRPGSSLITVEMNPLDIGRLVHSLVDGAFGQYHRVTAIEIRPADALPRTLPPLSSLETEVMKGLVQGENVFNIAERLKLDVAFVMGAIEDLRERIMARTPDTELQQIISDIGANIDLRDGRLEWMLDRNVWDSQYLLP